MTDAQIREIRDLHDGAEQGLWRYNDDGYYMERQRVNSITWMPMGGIFLNANNGVFIAAAHNIMPAMLAELDRLREAAKGAAVIADSAGQTIRELRAELDGEKRRYKFLYDGDYMANKAHAHKMELRANAAESDNVKLSIETTRLRAEMEAAKQDKNAVLDRFQSIVCGNGCAADDDVGIRECPFLTGENGCMIENMRGPVAENTLAPEMGAPFDDTMGGENDGR